jgi:hypothetical protein
MTTSSLYLTLSVKPHSRAANTDPIIKNQGGFQMSHKEGHLMVDGVKHFFKVDIKYPFEHGEVINYTLDVVLILPVTTKTHVSFLTHLSERSNGDYKTVTEFNGCDRRKLRMDRHCSFSTILT